MKYNLSSTMLCLRCMFLLLLLGSCRTSLARQSQLPNFVFFLVDDLGIGDVGCFGNDTIKTPNIDAIAASGAILRHHVAAAAVCTPSRAALLTGRYPVRSGMESSGMNKVFFFIAASGGLPENETTIAEILKDKGYTTAIVGKWHLGNDCHQKGDLCHHPLRHGFDQFYGLPLSNFKDLGDEEQSVITAANPNFYKYAVGGIVVSFSIVCSLYYSKYRKLSLFFLVSTVIIPAMICAALLHLNIINGIVMRNDQVVEQPIRLQGLTQRFVVESKEFIERSVAKGMPFFLFLSFAHVHTALFTSAKFSGKSKHGRYGDNIEEMDWAVGEIQNLLKKNEIINNTFTYFSSDNGGHVEEVGVDGQREGGHNGIFRGGKTIAGFEGGIRVPSMISWPDKIPSGMEINHLTSQMDLFVTVSDILKHPPPSNKIIDGRSLLPLLNRKMHRSPHNVLFHYCGRNIHAATYLSDDGRQVWKVHWASPKFLPGTNQCDFVCHCYGDFVVHHDPPLLYDLTNDPSESTSLNISTSPKYKHIIAAVSALRIVHEKSVRVVPDQFSFNNMMWKPWLQPCCNFPYCQCSDVKYLNIV